MVFESLYSLFCDLQCEIDPTLQQTEPPSERALRCRTRSPSPSPSRSPSPSLRPTRSFAAGGRTRPSHRTSMCCAGTRRTSSRERGCDFALAFRARLAQSVCLAHILLIFPSFSGTDAARAERYGPYPGGAAGRGVVLRAADRRAPGAQVRFGSTFFSLFAAIFCSEFLAFRSYFVRVLLTICSFRAAGAASSAGGPTPSISAAPSACRNSQDLARIFASFSTRSGALWTNLTEKAGNCWNSQAAHARPDLPGPPAHDA